MDKKSDAIPLHKNANRYTVHMNNKNHSLKETSEVLLDYGNPLKPWSHVGAVQSTTINHIHIDTQNLDVDKIAEEKINEDFQKQSTDAKDQNTDLQTTVGEYKKVMESKKILAENIRMKEEILKLVREEGLLEDLSDGQKPSILEFLQEYQKKL